MTAALAHLRVVEIGDDSGAYAGRLLAGLGAEVVRARVPQSAAPDSWSVDPDPVVQDFLHRGKAEVMLPAEESNRSAAIAELLRGADITIESGSTDVLATLGLDLDHPALADPELIRTRISPWGIQSERAGTPATDLISSAAGGFLALGGWPDRAPTRAYGDQSLRMASLYAAVGALLAVRARAISGSGQQVEVSVQESVATALENALQYSDLEGVVRRRVGAGYQEAGTGVYACSDGFVYVMVGRLSTAQGWVNLLDWLDEAGVPGTAGLRTTEWTDHEYRKSAAAQAEFRRIFESFAADRSKADLYVEAQRRNIAVCPVNSPQDLLASEHLNARDFFVTADRRRSVGAPFRLSATPWSLPVPTRVPA
ncbi:CoA transferase [Microcella indica]|uniref:CoA transferase n=1 Tax=Microcella indica TaxID=2750620 RepID=UPI001CD12862|nr:CoA transferase [Microcella indica]